MFGNDSPIKRRKRNDDDEMDITPMIDITFLLLIFFLVASKMDQAAALKLPPARHGLAVGARNAVVISVLGGGADGALIYRGEKLASGDLFKGDPVQQEEAITAYVDQQIEANTDLQYVIIKAEGDVKHADVARVAKAVGKSESAQQLYVAVLENT